ncbi:MAG: AI-2E family transporter [Balneolaceae bacterium]
MEFPWYAKYTVVLLGVILTIYAAIEARAVLQPLLFAFFLSILLSPSCGWFERRGLPRVISTLLGIIIGLLVLSGLVFFFYTQLLAFADDVYLFRERWESITESIRDFLSSYVGFASTIDFDELTKSLLEFFGSNTGAFLSQVAGVASTFTAIVLVPVFMFLLLNFREFLKEFVFRLFGRGDDQEVEKVRRILNKVKKVVQGYITGVLMVIVILAILNTTLLVILDVKHAVFFGVFAAVLNVIPFIGPLIGSVLPIIYSLITTDSLLIPLLVLLGFYVIQLFESNLFTPVIVGSQVSINAFVALLLIFIGAQIWGLVGMILIIPVGAILKVIFDEVESLKPYGYVMGRAPAVVKEKGPFAVRISNFAERVRFSIPGLGRSAGSPKEPGEDEERSEGEKG